MCWKCKKAILYENPIGRSMTCSSCGADIRCCKNCRFYSPGSYHDCAERPDELVSDKERANFCDQFQLEPSFRTDHGGKNETDASKKASDARSAFDSLFNS
ncbi:hypothetical protein K7I13_14015 [Brucepastera parasyntrophica]|uniref:hypothetical protein n=1 Tax=Brucepastera parasyntrophica TaxID=2880008 RepID=UPI00210E9991|nr:hypothetical protein [Brucepastera parasyntrophica]ULQ59563.1 hypothetical protein K7I13_14015 [Brucepastera parasyntrophica]